MKRFLSLFLALVIATSAVECPVQAANVPGIDAAVSKKNVLKLLNTYDKDGARLVKYGFSHGYAIEDMMMDKYLSQGEPVIEGLDTVVHEEDHMYSTYTDIYDQNNATKVRFYIGKGKDVVVPYTSVFRTREIVKSVPKRCRGVQSTRFDEYVMDSRVGTLASDWRGIYGLLNEFSAYSWGMNNNVKMFAYHDSFDDNYHTWEWFLRNGESNRLAYAEFKYYILQYMIYAKKYHPDVYKELLKNKKLMSAYAATEKNFAKSVKVYKGERDQIAEKIRANGYVVDYSNEVIIIRDATGNLVGYVGFLNDDTKPLTKELSKKKYKNMHKIMLKARK